MWFMGSQRVGHDWSGFAVESPLDCKIKSVNPKGNQSWIFIGRTDAEAKAPILWSPYAKSQLIGKDPDAGKDWRQEEKGMTEDEMAGWHHQLDGMNLSKLWELVMDRKAWHAACSPWGHKELDMTKGLNWTELYGQESWTIKKAVCQRINAFKYGAGKNSWQSFGLQDQISQS